MLAQGVATGELLQLTKPLHAPARQKRKKAQLPRLQLLIGKQQILQKALVFSQQSGFLVQRSARLPSQLLHLKSNLVARRVHRTGQRRVQFLDLPAQLR